jgi:hypothetical protein
VNFSGISLLRYRSTARFATRWATASETRPKPTTRACSNNIEPKMSSCSPSSRSTSGSAFSTSPTRKVSTSTHSGWNQKCWLISFSQFSCRLRWRAARNSRIERWAKLHWLSPRPS